MTVASTSPTAVNNAIMAAADQVLAGLKYGSLFPSSATTNEASSSSSSGNLPAQPVMVDGAVPLANAAALQSQLHQHQQEAAADGHGSRQNELQTRQHDAVARQSFPPPAMLNDMNKTNSDASLVSSEGSQGEECNDSCRSSEIEGKNSTTKRELPESQGENHQEESPRPSQKPRLVPPERTETSPVRVGTVSRPQPALAAPPSFPTNQAVSTLPPSVSQQLTNQEHSQAPTTVLNVQVNQGVSAAAPSPAASAQMSENQSQAQDLNSGKMHPQAQDQVQQQTAASQVQGQQVVMQPPSTVVPAPTQQPAIMFPVSTVPPPPPATFEVYPHQHGISAGLAQSFQEAQAKATSSEATPTAASAAPSPPTTNAEAVAAGPSQLLAVPVPASSPSPSPSTTAAAPAPIAQHHQPINHQAVPHLHPQWQQYTVYAPVPASQVQAHLPGSYPPVASSNHHSAAVAQQHPQQTIAYIPVVLQPIYPKQPAATQDTVPQSQPATAQHLVPIQAQAQSQHHLQPHTQHPILAPAPPQPSVPSRSSHQQQQPLLPHPAPPHHHFDSSKIQLDHTNYNAPIVYTSTTPPSSHPTSTALLPQGPPAATIAATTTPPSLEAPHSDHPVQHHPNNSTHPPQTNHSVSVAPAPVTLAPPPLSQQALTKPALPIAPAASSTEAQAAIPTVSAAAPSTAVQPPAQQDVASSLRNQKMQPTDCLLFAASLLQEAPKAQVASSQAPSGSTTRVANVPLAPKEPTNAVANHSVPLQSQPQSSTVAALPPLQPYPQHPIILPAQPGGVAKLPLPAYYHPSTQELEPNERDVLCGRGGLINKHIGNIVYRKVVEYNKPFYQSVQKRHRILVSQSIVHTILKRGGRFLSEDSQTVTNADGTTSSVTVWKTVATARAVQKTSQALREKIAAASAPPNKDATSATDTSDSKQAPVAA